jgi:hypothetical protein
MSFVAFMKEGTMRTKLILFIFVLAIVGCVTVNKSILNPNPSGRVFAKEEVHVFFETDSIPEHTRVAILTAKGDEDLTDEGEMIDKLREEAGRLGANAIVLGAIEDPSAGKQFVAALFGTSADRKGQAIAIYVPSLDKYR